ncbi:Alpha/Beta hydrolase protein [Rhodofomes roseus]|uniref:Alpha/Beta hydrolase protein n=1 Tax=Rhodofomes roseus TaxID=34475 RepID=A0A4Y9XX16_9APHY|nr:Alpha/Beta hydrolase protein [Rhodofomes roseus]KAH9834537.1 Alpha/Beta hydrolase protein [Rhodofomes roseus]TFY54625.1 hypothetical protein EVJ58_g8750 [Rhodofomes roseus]
MSETTGTVDFVVGSETFQTWYKVIGNLKSGTPPLVVLHGGPGLLHIYMRCHARLWETKGIPIVLYDQLGCGQSTHLPGKPKSFWTFELFIAELQNLVQKLGIEEYDMLGHSWGGVLAMKYVLTQQSKGLRRIVLSNSLASMRLWEAGCRELIAKLPKDVRDTIERCEREGKTDSQEYKDAELYFLKRHGNIMDPLPEDLLLSLEEQGKDLTVYLAVHGPSEFYCTGHLKDFDVIDSLHEIIQPTLVINGAADQATDLCVAPLFWGIPKAKWVQFAVATHQPFFEEADRYFEVVGDFLTM